MAKIKKVTKKNVPEKKKTVTKPVTASDATTLDDGSNPPTPPPTVPKH